ncbi:hypothetical protein M8J77_002473 [Diaphorina citri]|nr:hypothetical protein M8J77_002473 [Diaphorina citri]
MGSLSAIANPYLSCPIISQIYSAWCDLKTVGQYYVKLMWCPSHCGIRGNEAVDQAAKDPLSIVPCDREEDIVNEAIRNLSTPLKLCTPHDFKPWIAKLCRTQWQRSWDNILILKQVKKDQAHHREVAIQSKEQQDGGGGAHETQDWPHSIDSQAYT